MLSAKHIGWLVSNTVRNRSNKCTKPPHIEMHGHKINDSTGNSGRNGIKPIVHGIGRCLWTDRKAGHKVREQWKDPRVREAAKARARGRAKTKANRKAKSLPRAKLGQTQRAAERMYRRLLHLQQTCHPGQPSMAPQQALRPLRPQLPIRTQWSFWRKRKSVLLRFVRPTRREPIHPKRQRISWRRWTKR